MASANRSLSTPTDKGPAKGDRGCVSTGRGTLFQRKRPNGRAGAVVELPRSRNCAGQVVRGRNAGPVYRKVSHDHQEPRDCRPLGLLVTHIFLLQSSQSASPLFAPADSAPDSRRASASEPSKDQFDPMSCTVGMTYRFTALGREKYPSRKRSFGWLLWILVPAGALAVYQSVGSHDQRNEHLADKIPSPEDESVKEDTPTRMKLRSHKRRSPHIAIV